MGVHRLGRRGLGPLCLASAMLAGCSSPSFAPASTGAPGAQGVAQSNQGDLLYAATSTGADIFSYPDGGLVGTLQTPKRAGAICSNADGDVFIGGVNEGGGGSVYEYAHGGTEPIARLHGLFGWPFDCSFDETTQNLAAITAPGSGPDMVAIYTNAKGKPRTYHDATLYGIFSCTYDGSGNLFIDGENYSNKSVVAELPKGTSTFVHVKLTPPAGHLFGKLRWDGTDVAIEELPAQSDYAVVYRVRVTDSKGSIVATTKLAGYNIELASLYDGTAIGLERKHHSAIALWHYPAGGNPYATFGAEKQGFYGAAISAAAH
jgi:hypothetical protein